MPATAMATRPAVDIAMLASSWPREARLPLVGEQSLCRTGGCGWAAPYTGRPVQPMRLACDRLVAQTLRPGGFLAQTVALVRFVFLVIAVEECHLRIAFKREDVRGDTV